MTEESKNPNGRPPVVTDATLQKLERAFLMGHSDEEACLISDISTSTLYNYQNANPDFLERKKLLKSNPVAIARTTVYNKISTDADLALKFLERKKKDEFGTSQNINLGGQHGDNPVITKIVRVIVDPAKDTNA